MADLLGSILSSMEKPPVVDDKQRKLAREQKQKIEKQQVEEKAKLQRFRERTQKRIETFIKDSDERRLQFEPMPDKVARTIVHECAEVAGLASFSFGQDEVDRYVMAWKKEYAPSDDELLAYRRGEEWNEEKAKQLQEQREREKLAEQETANMKSTEFVPHSNYKDKYEKLIGKTAAKDAAIITTANKQYGFVPSENKTDKRSIEETMNQIREKKKKKLERETDALPADGST
ncbi:PREDICTED: sperm-associated antigen 7 homolog [Priapulus caudatus]|uniref:Sperm-associated antigen 7 homolog n=1 Tax=Priapulus caudatus TaxID=37621 RepID=A0ABM1EK55_PRICU|nr:PREDICTED: sperm-associated antigen 7 homolog [Priapulus caudatus]